MRKGILMGTKRMGFLSYLFILVLGPIFLSSTAFSSTVSIPVVSASKGEVIEIPVMVDNVASLGGFQFMVTYDPTVLTLPDINYGSMSPSPNWMMIKDIATPGQIKIGAYDQVLAGSNGSNASIVKLLFNVIGNQKNSTDINIISMKLSDIYGINIPATLGLNGFFSVKVIDNDGDGVPDDIDNRPEIYNPDQTDTDHDNIGDADERCKNDLPVKIGSSNYSSLQEAYDAAPDIAAIEVQAEALYQNIVADKGKSIILDGGYDCNWTNIPYIGETIFKGEIHNINSSLTLKNFYVRKYTTTPIDCAHLTGSEHDTDLDGIPDACDPCPTFAGTCDGDTDSDGMPDSFEFQSGLNRSDPYDAIHDNDNDGATNLQEYIYGTNPSTPDTDTDGDGIPDSVDQCGMIQPVKVSSVYYPSFQRAYNAVLDGDILQSQDEILIGEFNLNRDISVTINAGYDCNYSVDSGETIIKGNVEITDGSLRIDSGKLTIKKYNDN